MPRTSIKKTELGGYIVTNYRGHKMHFQHKDRAMETYNASKRVVKKRAMRRRK